MKNEKKLHGFSYSKSMANFETFCGSFSSSTNLIFLMSVKRRKNKIKSFEFSPFEANISAFKALCNEKFILGFRMSVCQALKRKIQSDTNYHTSHIKSLFTFLLLLEFIFTCRKLPSFSTNTSHKTYFIVICSCM